MLERRCPACRTRGFVSRRASPTDRGPWPIALCDDCRAVAETLTTAGDLSPRDDRRVSVKKIRTAARRAGLGG